MIESLRQNVCSSKIPKPLRSAGTQVDGKKVVGRKVLFQWENGSSYDAEITNFDQGSGMHTVQYAPFCKTSSQENHHSGGGGGGGGERRTWEELVRRK